MDIGLCCHNLLLLPPLRGLLLFSKVLIRLLLDRIQNVIDVDVELIEIDALCGYWRSCPLCCFFKIILEVSVDLFSMDSLEGVRIVCVIGEYACFHQHCDRWVSEISYSIWAIIVSHDAMIVRTVLHGVCLIAARWIYRRRYQSVTVWRRYYNSLVANRS